MAEASSIASSSSASSEGVVLDDEELQRFIDRSKAQNTVKKTRSDLNVWYKWCATVSEHRKVEDIPPKELNRLLSHFFVSVKKRNGKEYEPNSLTSFHRSIDRYLREKNVEIDVMNGNDFETSRKALEAKRKDLRRQGKGAKLNAAEALTEGEENALWSAGELGDTDPTVLLHTVWYLCTMHFGWRGVDEHRRVRFGDFEKGVDDDGVEFFELKVERGTKTRTGLEGQQDRAFNPRMYATGCERCPVKLLSKYFSLRPAHACLLDSPFYIQQANLISTETWYKNQPVGVNTLCKFMKTMTENAGVTGKKTNHSARKTTITKLVEQDINPLHVAQLSGHKNIKSIDSYSVASKKQQRRMSHLISGATPLKDSSNILRSSLQPVLSIQPGPPGSLQPGPSCSSLQPAQSTSLQPAAPPSSLQPVPSGSVQPGSSISLQPAPPTSSTLQLGVPGMTINRKPHSRHLF